MRMYLFGQTGCQNRHPRNLLLVAGSEYSRPTTEDNSCRTAVGLCRLLSPLKVRTRAHYLDSMLSKKGYSGGSAARS